jgi:splicing factor U2AF subunit
LFHFVLFTDFISDVREECSKFGKLNNIFITRFTEEGELPPVIQVFAIFEDKFECQNALRHVAGRTYGGRTVIAAYYPEERWANEDYYGAKVAKLISA